mmetsp:Transcript_25708/g.50329  ORF Transcript_25708/g.50329 Transcript_25708/m.50329 type:complete len:93 (+) Transcript_25708:270-548(+)
MHSIQASAAIDAETNEGNRRQCGRTRKGGMRRIAGTNEVRRKTGGAVTGCERHREDVQARSDIGISFCLSPTPIFSFLTPLSFHTPTLCLSL